MINRLKTTSMNSISGTLYDPDEMQPYIMYNIQVTCIQNVLKSDTYQFLRNTPKCSILVRMPPCHNLLKPFMFHFTTMSLSRVYLEKTQRLS